MNAKFICSWKWFRTFLCLLDSHSHYGFYSHTPVAHYVTPCGTLCCPLVRPILYPCVVTPYLSVIPHTHCEEHSSIWVCKCLRAMRSEKRPPKKYSTCVWLPPPPPGTQGTCITRPTLIFQVCVYHFGIINAPCRWKCDRMSQYIQKWRKYIEKSLPIRVPYWWMHHIYLNVLCSTSILPLILTLILNVPFICMICVPFPTMYYVNVLHESLLK